MPDDKNDGDDNARESAKAADAIALAFVFPLSIIGGFGIGYALDRWFHTGVVLKIVFTIFGTAAAFIQLFRFGKSSG